MEKTTTNYSWYVNLFFAYFLSLLIFFLSATSQFWMDVNKKVDTQINFSQLEDFFQVNTENNNTTSAAKPIATAVRKKYYF